MARTLIAAAIVVGLLGACATPGFRMFGATQSCDTPNCPIVEVTVLVNQTENMFHLKDKNKDDVYAYGYQIKVYEIATGIWIALDPWVVNN